MDDETQVAVLGSELRRAQADITGLAAQVAAVREEQALLRTQFEVMRTRVAMYAAVGASIGGALLSVILDALTKYLRV